MTEQRDPVIERLFADAERVAGDDVFQARVLDQVNRQRRRTIATWVLVAAILLPLTGYLAAPVIDLAGFVSRFLPQTLIELEDGLLAVLLSPVNSVAGLAGLVFLGLWAAVRRLFF